MQYFPLFLNLNDKPVLVVGGGEVACRKVDALIRAGALVTIVSPKIEPYLLELVEQKRCQWVQNFYSSELLTNDYLQVWATTDNPSLNHQVHKDAKNSRILVNVVDDQPYCDFITPSMIERGRIQIAISSGGASPVLVRNIRETLEAVLPQNLSLLADFGSSKRNSIKQSLASVSERRKFWEEFLAEPKVENAKNREDLEALYQQALKQPIDNEGQCTWINFGDDVELLPIKALRYMQRAEIVFFEENCPFEFIDLVRRDAERESFQDAAQLAEKLNQARAEKRRICVLMPKQATDYTLLIGADLTL
ncbi:siroheme synthase [Vibrio aestuarianus]|uniref:precorrin-2 dehydrogenase/sirohydrochlorin ferrochelatase family protein n=1 Tax=Vibrio aestuarianus TaxID=28171 RepID=UPI0015597BA4|nr:bifunctional precorrin-2 dehydrogenase/sirohydrochlorin ferrochelatase [Vibrio aestuarianus]NGZ15045.1 siroheme synthase [Vibrio aestuarianus]NKZ51193.1 siroheme synthase [Vibrio aestuarianus]